MKRKLVGVIENHFDQIWRRSFKKDFIYKGENFVSYEKIESFFIDENLKLYESLPDYKFGIESPCAVENYLEKHPEKEELFKKLYKSGVLKTSNTGYAIVDSNMIGTEAIIRNYLISDDFFAKFVGSTPKIANRSDAFGNSAQLPQILRSFGADYLTEIYYNPFDDDVWVGLDKTAICVTCNEHLGAAGGYFKQIPCKRCKGFGRVNDEACPDCNGMGIELANNDKKWVPIWLNPEKSGDGIVRLGGEEVLPNAHIYEMVADAAKNHNVDFSIGHWDFLLELYKDEIEKVNSGNFEGLKVRQTPEFNPNNTGGYISRIKTKQRLTDCENKLLAGETIEAMKYISGESTFSYDKIWRNFMICGFHDSAAGTTVDVGYDEIMEMFDEIEVVAQKQYLAATSDKESMLFNPTSTAYKGIIISENGEFADLDIPAYSNKSINFVKPDVVITKFSEKGPAIVEGVLTGKEKVVVAKTGEKSKIENESFEIEFDNRGINKITHKKYGDIAVKTGDVRPLQWVFQSDNGSPWATLEPPATTLSLSDTTNLLAIEESEEYKKICFTTTIPMPISGIVGRSKINWSVTLAKGYKRIIINADVKWESANKRLMLRIPLSLKNGRDIYGIPGGWLERELYEPTYTANGANGDWPAFRFGGVETECKSIAVFNRGIPAYRILPDNNCKILDISVLRSPSLPAYLHEPESYTMTEYDGMRDEGNHSFEFELAVYGTAFNMSSVITDAEHFSRPPLPIKAFLPKAEMPSILNGTATLSHIKVAEDKNGIIVRVTEHSGEDGVVCVSVPNWVKEIYRTDMPEKACEKMLFAEQIAVPLRGFEIATLRFVK